MNPPQNNPAPGEGRLSFDSPDVPTFSPIQGMHICQHGTGDFVTKADWNKEHAARVAAEKRVAEMEDQLRGALEVGGYDYFSARAKEAEKDAHNARYVAQQLQSKLAAAESENARMKEAIKEVQRRTSMLIHQNNGRWDSRIEHDARTIGVLNGNQRILADTLAPAPTTEAEGRAET